jgi:hypothetical protein
VSDVQMGMGCAVGDLNGDGWPDLIVTGLDDTRLYLHQGLDAAGRPTFRNVAVEAGIEQSGFATAVALNDLDGDGNLDVVIVRYLTYHEPKTPAEQMDERNEPQEFVPRNFPAEPDLLYLNRGVVDGVPRFERVKDSAIGDKSGKGLGVLFTDLDLDMRPDVYVANDVSPNKLFANRNGELVEISEVAGALANDDRSGMGLELGDVDGDGRPDIFATYWQGETVALYRNEPPGNDPDLTFKAFFTDLAPGYGLAGPSVTKVGWGACLADFDLDGWLDVFVGNGFTSPPLGDSRRASCMPQLPSLFFCEPGGRAPHFRLAGAEAGAIVKQALNARGVAAGDLDGDGDVDLVITQNQGPAIILRNDTQRGRHWLKIRLAPLTDKTEAKRSPPHGIGAEVIVAVGERKLHRWVLSGESYLSHSSFEIELGLGEAREADAIEVRWPSGRESHLGRTAADQVLEIGETR